MSRSSRSVRSIWLGSRLNPRVLKPETIAAMPRAQAVVTRPLWRRTLGHGDDPGLGLAVRMHHGDRRAGAFAGQRDVLQPVFAAREAIRQGRLAAVVEHAQVLLAAQPPAPAVIATPGDQRG